MSNTARTSILNPVAAQQSDKWHSVTNDWYGAFDLCECTERMERLASCISALFYSIAVGGRPRYKLLDKLKATYKFELEFYREHHPTGYGEPCYVE